MTDEKEIEIQAEIYTKEKHCKKCVNIPICWENAIEDCCPDCRKTNEDFIAGAKWGMEHAIEWHDLRKDPNDLPQRSGLYCVQCGEVREFDKEEKSWLTVNFEPCMNRTDETFLWCELPQFKE